MSNIIVVELRIPSWNINTYINITIALIGYMAWPENNDYSGFDPRRSRVVADVSVQRLEWVGSELFPDCIMSFYRVILLTL